MSDEQKTKSPNPKDWPREWVQDPDFWRDVATRTIAGILALIFVFLMGLAGGYLKSPDNWALFLAVGAALVGAVLISMFAFALVSVKGPPGQMRTVDEAARGIRRKRAKRTSRYASKRGRRSHTP